MIKKLILLIVISGATILYGENESYSYKNIKSLKIDSAALDIEIIAGKGSDVTVELIDISNRIDIKLEQNGDELSLESKIVKHFSFFYFKKNRVVFHVPESTILDIEGSAGDIKVDGLKSERNQIVSSAGDIKILNSSGEFLIKSSAGDQIIKEYSGVLNSSSKAGDIIGRGVRLTGDSLFSSTVGDISIEFTNKDNSIHFVTSSSIGDIRIKDSIGAGNIESPIKVRGNSTVGDQTYR